jgi:hypothetical protein
LSLAEVRSWIEMKVVLLFFDGCPGYEQLRVPLERLAADAGASVEHRRVETRQQADGLRFLGSPTVRVDGRDVEPGADSRSDYGLKCRLYRDASGGHSRVPSDALIKAALRASTPLADDGRDAGSTRTPRTR